MTSRASSAPYRLAFSRAPRPPGVVLLSCGRMRADEMPGGATGENQHRTELHVPAVCGLPPQVANGAAGSGRRVIPCGPVQG